MTSFVVGILLFFAFLIVALIGRRVLRRLLERLDINASIIALSSQTAFYGLVILGFISGLGTMGVNVSALVASLGLGGFALGFALRDAIANVLAGVMVLIYQPFGVGDYIVAAGQEGTVLEINLRYTVLQGESMRHLIPNQMLLTQPIKLYEAGARDQSARG
jgi:small-conductance mechanosensitive channel